MKLLIQVVTQATIKIENNEQKIWKWLLIYLGIDKSDILDYKVNIDKICLKLSTLKLFAEKNQINKSLKDIDWEILLVSNFTLYWNHNKWTKIDFSDAAPYNDAEKIYNYIIEELKKHWYKIKTWTFWAHMNITSENDGPLNFIFDY